MPWGPREGVQAYLYSFFNLDARCGWVVNTTSLPLCTRERNPVHICIGGWVGPSMVWTGAENLALTGIRSPDLQPVASFYTDWAIAADHDINILM
jgi:hypothetical protein